MTALLVVLVAGSLAISSVALLADDSYTKPLSRMKTSEAKAALAAAKTKWDKMTPEERAAAKKAARHKRLADYNALDMIADESISYDANRRPLMGDFPSPNDPMRNRRATP